MATTNSSPTTVQPGDGVDISARRARGAFPGRHVLMVLIASLALVVVAFLIAFATNPTTPVGAKAGNGKVEEPGVVRTFDTPVQPPKPVG